MLQSPQWKDGHFENPEPLVNDLWASMLGFLNRSEHISPHDKVSVLNVDLALLATAPASGLRVTWMGHSSVLIEIDEYRVLTDPIWAQRASPLPWVGPQRWYDPRIALAKLPKLDAVVISHDHYDHLDHATVVAMKDWNTKFVVSLGVAAHLEYWGVAPSKIVELDWWEHVTIGTLQVHCTPAPIGTLVPSKPCWPTTLCKGVCSCPFTGLCFRWRSTAGPSPLNVWSPQVPSLSSSPA